MIGPINLGCDRGVRRVERIDVRLLGPEKTAFHWQEPASGLGLGDEPAFRHPVVISVAAQLVGARVLVNGTVASRLTCECSRCLVEFEWELKSEVAVEFREEPQPEAGGDVAPGGEADADEGAETSVFVAPFIDLGEDLRQILLVAAPPYPVCHEKCRGLCPRCGANLNSAVCGHVPEGEGRTGRPFESLGMLLEKEHEGHG